MEKCKRYVQEPFAGIQLPEFSTAIPTCETVGVIAERFQDNRARLKEGAAEFGLNPDFLQRQEASVIVGPFVSPAPLPTTFAGSLENFKTSLLVGRGISDRLNTQKTCGFQAVVVNLTMTEIPVGGAEAMDCLVVPRNATENQKLMTSGKARKGQAYGFIGITEEDVARIKKGIQDTYPRYVEREDMLKQKKYKGIIPDALVADLYEAYAVARAMGETPDVQYIRFAAAFNDLIVERVAPSPVPPVAFVDTQVYSPFLKEGIDNPAQFLKKTKTAGFLDDRGGFVKIVDKNGMTQILSVRDVAGDDLILTPFDVDRRISFRDLQQMDIDIAPCKELSYLLCFANIVPVVYGSQNSGGYYEPYAKAKQQISRLGLTPNMYRVQEPIPNGYRDIKTVYDFYKDMLIPKEE